MTQRLLQSLADRVLVGDDCWEWTGALNRDGYGHLAGKLGHRLVYELVVGPIAEGMTLDHECHNLDETCRAGGPCSHRRCVRPSHMRQRSNGANVRAGRTGELARARWRTRTHCKRGHVVVWGKQCAECRRIRDRNAYRLKVGLPLDTPVRPRRPRDG